MRRGGAPLFRGASCLLSISAFSRVPMASHALRLKGSRGPGPSLRGSVLAFQGLSGAASWTRERACSGERVPGRSTRHTQGALCSADLADCGALIGPV